MRSVLAALFFLLLPVAAHAQCAATAFPKLTLDAQITADFPTQTSGYINPAILSNFLNNAVASWQQGTIVNAQVGTSYTVNGDTSGLSDNGKLVTFNNSSPVSVTLGSPASSGFCPFGVYLSNLGTGTVSVSSLGGALINGSSSISLTQGQSSYVVSDGTNWQVVSGSSSGSVPSFPLSLANGGTGAALVASNGGIVYSNASTFGVLAGTVTANQCLLSGSNTLPHWGSCSGAAAVSSVSNSDSTLTISPTTGNVVSSLNLAHANTWTAAQTFTDSDFLLKGSSSGAMTLKAPAVASTFVMTFPAATDTVAVLGLAQTFTAAKSFNNGTLVLNGQTSGTITLNTVSIAGSNTITFPALTDTVAVLGSAQTWTGPQTFSNGDLLLKGSVSGAMALEAPASASAFIMTFPAATDTVAVLGISQAFTGIDTFSNILVCSGQCEFTNTSNPTLVSGVAIAGQLGAVLSGGFSNGVASVYSTGLNGLVMQGQGSSQNLAFASPTGVVVARLGTGNAYLTGKAWDIASGDGTVPVNGFGSPTASNVAAYANGQKIQNWTASTSQIFGTLTLGNSGSSVGMLALANATSGTVTIQPPTGSLGSSVLTAPAVTGTLITTGDTNTVTNAMLAQAAGATFKGNATGSTANVADIALGALSQDVSPDVNADKIPILKNATGTFQWISVNTISSGGVSGVASLNGLSGSLSVASPYAGVVTTSGGDTVNIKVPLVAYISTPIYGWN